MTELKWIIKGTVIVSAWMGVAYLLTEYFDLIPKWSLFWAFVITGLSYGTTRVDVK